MDGYLNWTFDYRMHQKPNCDFYQKVTELLEQRQCDAGNPYCYSILPNFHFNHLNPDITGQKDLVVGRLFLQKRLEQKKRIYQIQRIDSTSGETMSLLAAMNSDACMSLTDYRILRHSINGKTIAVKPDHHFLNNGALTSVYAIPELIRSSGGEIADFSFVDRYGQIHSAQKLKKVGSDMLEIGGTQIKITGYCLLGPANPPSYWWMDERGNLLIVSTTLLTYAAGPSSEMTETAL